MSKTFFTADPHFSHGNLTETRYSARPFKNAHEMDKTIIGAHNEAVGPDDTVFILGDFTMSGNRDVVAAYLDKLNGTKHLILGNHDRLKPFAYVDCGFASVHTSLVVQTEIGSIFMAHDPSAYELAKLGGYDYYLCGHVHNLFTFAGGVLNVGVDRWNWNPLDLEQIEYFYKLYRDHGEDDA